MFWIFKIFPDWIWLVVVILGFAGLLLSAVPQLKPYNFILKIFGLVTLVVGIFINGMLYADNCWKQAAADLQNKVTEAENKAAIVNTEIKERVINKLQIVKVRGDETIKYIDKEVIKYDTTCKIPAEFVEAHNRAAEQPK